jgi:hypothetical protein
MILVDANLLVYAKVKDFPQHEAARAWFEEVLASPGRVGLPWPALVSYVRMVTNLRLFSRPLSPTQAWNDVQEWLEAPGVWSPTPTPRHAAVLAQLIQDAGATANLVADAHMAALAIEHGLQLCSTDSDFARFTDLRWSNPIRGSTRVPRQTIRGGQGVG